MSISVSRQSSKSQEQISGEHIAEEKIVKKQFNSNEKTTTTTTSTSSAKTEKQIKNSLKQPIKMTLAELKNLKNLRSNQQQILIAIENENIEKHVQTLLQKFDPPYCANCPKRRADRVCINKACGQERYMQVICGKCHYDEHQKIINKSEIDIEEYFVKLSKFLNEQKQNLKKMSDQKIDLGKLDTIFDELDNFRQKLTSLRSNIENEIDSYTGTQEMQNKLQNNIIKALSLCEYNNIQEQLVNIKKSIRLEKNQFIWNDSSKKFLDFSNIFNDLQKFKDQTNKKLSQSFILGREIDLNELEVKELSVDKPDQFENLSVGSQQTSLFGSLCVGSQQIMTKGSLFGNLIESQQATTKGSLFGNLSESQQALAKGSLFGNLFETMTKGSLFRNLSAESSINNVIKANKDGEIGISCVNSGIQFYIDYNLKKDKKYKMRFRIDWEPQNYIMVGVMQKSRIRSHYVHKIRNQYFCKRFLNKAPNQECSKLLKGNDLSNNISKDMQIEMRIDFENNYVDFYDYPDIKNINASLDDNRFTDGEYVIAFVIHPFQLIVIESLQELSDLEVLDVKK